MKFQKRVHEWMLACFGDQIAQDKVERSHRFLEEALELVQAADCTQTEAHQLVDYVFNRPVGSLGQETGGVMVTLAAFCNAYGMSIRVEAEGELDRCWHYIEKIRAEQAAKPKFSPFPE